MENAFNQAFFKIFKTFDRHIAEHCQVNLGYLPASLLLDVKKLNFRTKLRSMNFNLMHILTNRGYTTLVTSMLHCLSTTFQLMLNFLISSFLISSALCGCIWNNVLMLNTGVSQS